MNSHTKILYFSLYIYRERGKSHIYMMKGLLSRLPSTYHKVKGVQGHVSCHVVTTSFSVGGVGEFIFSSTTLEFQPMPKVDHFLRPLFEHAREPLDRQRISSHTNFVTPHFSIDLKTFQQVIQIPQETTPIGPLSIRYRFDVTCCHNFFLRRIPCSIQQCW